MTDVRLLMPKNKKERKYSALRVKVWVMVQYQMASSA